MPQMIKQYFVRDTSFANLMQKRIYNVLLIARKYEAFMLEEDGRIDEKIFFEYVSLNLRYPPRFTQVVEVKDAINEMHSRHYDLVMVMPGAENFDVFDDAKSIKAEFPKTPIVVLTPFFREVALRLANEDLSAIDYVFCWLGNADLLLAIIKLLEDRMNAGADVESVGVQTILVVEDSIRFYSSLLPQLYKIVLRQSQIFSKEALNEHEMMLRMRGRPKILLARSYEEAEELYNRFSHNILGIVSDVSFMHKQAKDKKAGIAFCEHVRRKDPFVPIIMQSSESENRAEADRLEACFMDKNSRQLTNDFRDAVIRNFGFGRFEFKNPANNSTIASVDNLHEFQRILFEIPEESLLYHASRNHLSRWFCSRAMFPLAEYIRQHRFTDYCTFEEGREAIFNAIVEYRKMKNRGIVAVFQKERYDQYSHFARIGNGTLGGKGRGLAFIDSLLKRRPEFSRFDPVNIRIPKTLILCSDLFDEFMESNRLYATAMSSLTDSEILSAFLKAELPETLREDCRTFLRVVQAPIAIRSSSTLEDSHYLPFAGVYATYMIPFLPEDKMLDMLASAIKSVYASVFYRESKSYLQATQNRIDEEKMSIILQELAGRRHDTRFYPTLSGVARSINFYPIMQEKAEEGIAQIALGLGKYIVDGGKSIRFSPAHPQHILQLSNVEMTLRETQTEFYALDARISTTEFPTDDGFNLIHLPVKEAEADGELRYTASTYSAENRNISDTLYEKGRRVITFNPLLRYDKFPLAELLKTILAIGEEEMGCPVEIEFAINLNESEAQNDTFYWLQIRPVARINSAQIEHIENIQPQNTIIYSNQALGNLDLNDLTDIIYVRSSEFKASENSGTAAEIAMLNEKLTAEGRNYVLVGPGRWGSADPWLGIPVKWADISAARVIVETVLENYRIEPSQGTHFFQNLTSFGVGYFTVNPFLNTGYFNESKLNGLPVMYESKALRHIRFDKELSVKIDGKKGIGVIIDQIQ